MTPLQPSSPQHSWTLGLRLDGVTIFGGPRRRRRSLLRLLALRNRILRPRRRPRIPQTLRGTHYPLSIIQILQPSPPRRHAPIPPRSLPLRLKPLQKLIPLRPAAAAETLRPMNQTPITLPVPIEPIPPIETLKIVVWSKIGWCWVYSLYGG